MKQRRKRVETWETPSLDWIHRVRRQRQAARRGRAVRPLSRQEAERLVARYGLKLTRKTAAG
jgi:hypothetical protein